MKFQQERRNVPRMVKMLEGAIAQLTLGGQALFPDGIDIHALEQQPLLPSM